MIKKTIALMLASLLLVGTAASAATVVKSFTFTFNSGTFAGEDIRFEYAYPYLPAGQDIFSYSPTLSASVSFLDAYSATPSYQLAVFSGGADILDPEVYLEFSIDPASNANGVDFIAWWVTPLGLNYAGAPDIMTMSCGVDGSCAYTTTVIPLPSTLALALTGLLGLGMIGTVRKRRGLLVASA